MDNYDEKMNYSFEPLPQEPPAAHQPPLEQAKEEIRRSGKHTGLKIAALLAAVAIVAGVGGSALTKAIDAIGQKNLAGQQTAAAMSEQTVEPETAPEAPAPADAQTPAYRLDRKPLPDALTSNEGDKTLTLTQVYKMNIDAVCNILIADETDVWEQASYCIGSGFVLTEDGYIVTNNHVVDGANGSPLTVQLHAGDEYPAEVVGTDSMNDVALLKIEAAGLQTVSVGDSDEVEIGETVAAIGNALGELPFTMTSGCISAIGREVDPDGTPITMLQTDALINAGNSGGPLLDMNGNVIGIITAKYTGTSDNGVVIEGLSFAIPINDVLRVVYDLQQYGRVRGRAYLGVTLQNLDAQTAAVYGLPSGPQVVTVTEGSCSEKAGLQPHDIIVEFDGREIGSYSDLVSALSKKQAGDTVKMKLYRAGAELEVTLTLDERPDENEIDAVEQQAQDELNGQTEQDDGFTLPDFGDFGDFGGYGYDYGG